MTENEKKYLYLGIYFCSCVCHVLICGLIPVISDIIKKMKLIVVFSMMLFLTFPLWPQNLPVYAGLDTDEQLSFVGMMLADLIGQFGSPRSVIAERGIEIWQDDVVFQYNGADFYIYRDRVWQVKIASTHGISNGDRKAAVLLVFGDLAEDMGDHLLIPISGRDWPLMMRVNFNNADDTGIVTAIFIYRPDF